MTEKRCKTCYNHIKKFLKSSSFGIERGDEMVEKLTCKLNPAVGEVRPGDYCNDWRDYS